MRNTHPQSERRRVTDAIVATFPLDDLGLPDTYFPAHLPVALIDAFTRVRSREDESSGRISGRYCRHFGLARVRPDRWSPPPAHEQESLSDLVRHYDDLGPDAMAGEVLGIRRRRSGAGNAMAAAVLRAATMLLSIGIDILQDVFTRPAGEIRQALESLPGLGANTARRVLMYTGADDFVLGDADVRRFVARALDRTSVSPDAAEALVREAAYDLILSPRFLDREIWLHGLSLRSRTSGTRAPLS